MSEMRTYECWVYNLGCRADMVSKAEADAVIAEQDAKIAELKKERDWLAKDRAQAYDDLEKRAQLNIQKDAEICRHKKEVEQLLMKIAGLEKLVEIADKFVKQKGGFTVKDISFDGVKLEGMKND